LTQWILSTGAWQRIVAGGDVCKACFREREEGVQKIATCVEHSFLKVDSGLLPDSHKNLASREAEKALWFEDLRTKYVGCVD
jgi:hypothetical protein